MPGFRDTADVEKLEKVPLEERDLPRSTYEIIQRGADAHPDRDALVFFLRGADHQRPTRFTYKEMMEQVNRSANLFRSLGVGKDDAVALLLPNLPETWFVFLGAGATGIASPINPLLEPEGIAEIMNAAGAKLLVTLAPFPGTDVWQKAEQVIDLVPTLEAVLTVDLARYLSGPKKLAISALRLLGPKAHTDRLPVHDLKVLLEGQPKDRLVGGGAPEPDDLAAYFHTGGTTGSPKLALHTHRMEVFDAWASGQTVGHDSGMVALCGLPLFHVNGVVVTGLTPWSLGGTVVLATPQGYRGNGVIKNFWKIVAHHRPAFFAAVPAVYSTLLEVPLDGADVSSLDFALCGASPMPPETFREFERRTGVRVLEGYGLTEGTCVSAVNPAAGERRVGSIGLRYPYQPMKVVLLDDDGGYRRDCEIDEVGVVLISGPNVFPGYKEERHNQDAWIEADGVRWFNTGDLGRCDTDGYFWLAGRKKELIIRGGHNIDPQAIEAPLAEHPSVTLAAAVGRPDQRVGELPVAYVQPKPGTLVDEEELLAFLREGGVERAAMPKMVRVVEELPLTAVGKTFKPALRWREIQDVYSREVAALGGVVRVEVEVRKDPHAGARAYVRVEPSPTKDRDELAAAISETLGRYDTLYDLSFETVGVSPDGTGAAPSTPPDSAHTDLDTAVTVLRERKNEWLELPVRCKIEYARSAMEGTLREAEAMVVAACQAKGVTVDSTAAGEEWFGGPVAIIRSLRLHIRSLESLAGGTPPIGEVGYRPNGDLKVEVLPLDMLDKVLFSGHRAEVWTEPDVFPEELLRRPSGVYGESVPEPAVALVLGAGNVASIGPLDVVHKLFVEGQVALLKFNPVNAYLGPFFERAFEALIRDGFVRIAYGGAKVGAYLCEHPGVDNIHITGSGNTHDAIVWGTGEEAEDRKVRGKPKLEKPISSELGNVSPIIIVPGDWSVQDLRFQAEHVATQIQQNAGFNCAAGKVVILHEEWPQRDAFLRTLNEVLAELTERPAYYPGAEDRYERFLKAHTGAKPPYPPRTGTIPPTLIPHLDFTETDALAFSEESFCALAAETPLPGRGAADFLEVAVRFCNEVLYGTLSATIIVDPRTRKILGDDFLDMVERLRYGTIGVNVWPGLSFGLGTTPWGAYPGNTLAQTGSGIGFVHNAMMVRHPRKSVVYAPFRQPIKPPWFITHARSPEVGRRLAAAEAQPSLGRILRVAAVAARG